MLPVITSEDEDLALIASTKHDKPVVKFVYRYALLIILLVFVFVR